ncbi:MAG: bifunctional methylenetetrahydrofolate dehydrogenase/methenyltetrahydrofolate cyclohydrolase FolD [Bacteroidota bacterium]
MILIDGKKTSGDIKDEIAIEVSKLVAEGKRAPHLAAVLVGDDGASQTYVNAKVKACEKVGFESTLVRFSAETSEEELLAKIDEMNNDEGLDGFIVQLPLPKHIDEQKVTLAINPDKDVDGFHPTNLGKMLLGQETFLPATPYGIVELIKRYGVETSGKHAVIIGRSHIVGSPMSVLLAQKGIDCTVTLTHSRTKDLKEITRQADIVVVANGIPEFLKGDMVKDGVVVIDVGITRVEDKTKKSGFRLLGDVKFDEVSKKASHITPVPGGVGPMTIAMLMKNTLQSRKRRA